MDKNYRIARRFTLTSVLALVMVLFTGIALAIEGEGGVTDSLNIVRKIGKDKKKNIELKIIKKIRTSAGGDSIISIDTTAGDPGDMDELKALGKDGKRKAKDIEVKVIEKIRSLEKYDSIRTFDGDNLELMVIEEGEEKVIEHVDVEVVEKIRSLERGESVVTVDSTVRIVTRDGRKLAEYLPLANQPRIKGGLKELAKYLAYPYKAKEAGIEGNVLVQVLVGTDGKPGEIKLIKGIGYGCDEAAIEAVRKLEFTPAVYEGEKVEMWFVIPIRFKLPEKTENQDKSAIPPYLPLENQPKIKGGLQSLAKLLIYPDKAKEAGIEGTVHVQVLVGADGKPGEIKLIEGIGYGCDEAAIEAVKKLEFAPATQNGKSVAFWFTIPVRFMLADTAK